VNKALYIASLTGFLLLPFGLLLIRAWRPKLMPWWAMPIIIAALGWILVNSTVYYYFEYLDVLIRPYGDNPPPELEARWANDGAKRVFALVFGWAYGLVYSLPIFAAYGIVRLVFTRRGRREIIFPTTYNC